VASDRKTPSQREADRKPQPWQLANTSRVNRADDAPSTASLLCAPVRMSEARFNAQAPIFDGHALCAKPVNREIARIRTLVSPDRKRRESSALPFSLVVPIKSVLPGLGE
jgi:hypothetical protein